MGLACTSPAKPHAELLELVRLATTPRPELYVKVDDAKGRYKVRLCNAGAPARVLEAWLTLNGRDFPVRYHLCRDDMVKAFMNWCSLKSVDLKDVKGDKSVSDFLSEAIQTCSRTYVLSHRTDLTVLCVDETWKLFLPLDLVRRFTAGCTLNVRVATSCMPNAPVFEFKLPLNGTRPVSCNTTGDWVKLV